MFIKNIANSYKNAYSGLTKNMWLLSGIMFINRCGTMVVAFLSIYCTAFLGYNKPKAGIIVGCYGLGAIAGAYIGGRLTDKYGSKKIQVLSLFFSGLLFILISFFTHFFLLVFLFFILGLVNESFRPANAAAVLANSSPENRTRSFSLLRLAMNLGWASGTALGGWFTDFNYQLIFWVDGGTSLIAAIVLYFTTLTSTLVKTTAETVISPKIVSPLKNKAFLYFLIVCLIFTCCFFQLFIALPLFYKEALQLSGIFIGCLLASNGVIIGLVEMVLIQNIEGRYSKRIIIIMGCFFISLFFIISACYKFTNPYLNGILGMAVVTFGEMLTLPFMNSYYVTMANPTNAGAYSGYYMMSWSIGQIIVSVFGLLLLQYIGFTNYWIFCALLSIIALFGFLKVIKK